jgi:hypothetical protein
MQDLGQCSLMDSFLWLNSHLYCLVGDIELVTISREERTVGTGAPSINANVIPDASGNIAAFRRFR